jgi:hypothetical protein
MWLFTRWGFYSISVQNNSVAIRARLKKHLEKLQARFPDRLGKYKIQEDSQNDYKYRLIVARKTWLAVGNELMAEQDWSNFKNEAQKEDGHDDYVTALHEIWQVLYDLQEDEAHANGWRAAAKRWSGPLVR